MFAHNIIPLIVSAYYHSRHAEVESWNFFFKSNAKMKPSRVTEQTWLTNRSQRLLMPPSARVSAASASCTATSLTGIILGKREVNVHLMETRCFKQALI